MKRLKQAKSSWQSAVEEIFPGCDKYYEYAKDNTLYFLSGSTVTFDDLARLSKALDSIHIDLQAQYEEGCSTCGGSNTQEISIRNICLPYT